MSEKTEPASPRRLREARAKGDGPKSSTLPAALGFWVGIAMLPSLLLTTSAVVVRSLRTTLTPGASQAPTQQLLETARDLRLLTLPWLAAIALVACLTQVAQRGGQLTLTPLRLQLPNPVQGFAQLFSWSRLGQPLRAITLAALIAVEAGLLLLAAAPSIAACVGNLRAGTALTGLLVTRLLHRVALTSLVLGLLELGLAWRSFLHRNRMSTDEKRREHRESEGNPELAAERRQRHREVLAQAAIRTVREATVLVVNPTHLAVALRYNEGQDEAPVVLGHGEGELAARMRQAAEAWGIPVVQDVPLARALVELASGDAIPEELYEAVAAVLRELLDAAEQP